MEFIFLKIFICLRRMVSSFFLEALNKLTTKVLNNILQKKYRYFTSQNSTNFIKTIANDSVVFKAQFNVVHNYI